MTLHKSILRVLCLSAVCFFAFGAANASALTMHECKKAEFGATGQNYSDGLCTNAAAGEFRTVPTTLSTTVKLTTTDTDTFAIASTIAGIKVRIECQKLSGSGEATNEEPKAGTMQVSGKKITSSYSFCQVKEPSGKGCSVVEPIVTTNASSITTEHKTKFTPENAEKKFAAATVTGCIGAAAPLNGEKSLTGTATMTTPQTTPTISEFTSTSGSELKFGGQTATFTGKTQIHTFAGVSVALETP